jgi:glycosyltransferase involved in cell wall biosynthesis
VKQKVIKRFGIRNVTVTPNAVDGSIFHPGAKQRKLDVPENYFLFVGTLEPRKNLNVLLKTWIEIKDKFIDTWCIVAGASGHVFKDVDGLQPMERVCFLGYVDDETLAGLYANATLFVLPSQEEGFGLPALEAMACGAPVLVSDGGALPEVVAEAGMIFCLSEPAGLKNALIECLTNTDVRLALKEKGLARAKRFSWQTTAELVWECLHEI